MKQKSNRHSRFLILFFLRLFIFSIFTGKIKQNLSGQSDSALSGIEISYLDVHQGNASLIQADGRVILFDTGSYSNYPLLKKQLSKKGISHIDCLILSHPDADHMGSAASILTDYSVPVLYQSRLHKDTKAFQKLTEAIEQNQVTVHYPNTGDTLSLSRNLSAQVLSANAGSKNSDDANAASLVLRMTYGSCHFLFMSDAPASVESDILSTYDVRSDVYLVSHHGSDTANGISFIKEVGASYAVISVGKDNSYGHPDKNVLSRLKKYAQHVLRTDEDGMITITSDGKPGSLSCQTEVLSDNIKKHEKTRYLISIWFQ
ncbi:MAG: MBL fold metallo-hydrolase [Clostridiales bacterium]|nr:MBL fold metallo-hydrolase [Clostridiales bacterium]